MPTRRLFPRQSKTTQSVRSRMEPSHRILPFPLRPPSFEDQHNTSLVLRLEPLHVSRPFMAAMSPTRAVAVAPGRATCAKLGKRRRQGRPKSPARLVLARHGARSGNGKTGRRIYKGGWLALKTVLSRYYH
ncbi:uncharacterized protein BKA78DRAFT_41094 [Phyllosticta capitalensis]|uniref:uncharacterized protein n=1 Tax=Phyllosticta capitalensis TaxID=121624 RepID=UPI0031314D9D